MKRHVFTLAPFPEGTTWTVRVPALVHQIVRVLKLRIGEEVEFVDGKGKRRQGEIVRLAEHAVDVSVQSFPFCHSREGGNPAQSEPAPHLYICAAILKHDRFEWLTEKLAEIGVTDLLPLVSARTIKKDVRLERLQTIANEAMEQSEQATCMRIHAPMDLFGAHRFLTRLNTVAVVCDIGKHLKPLEQMLVETKARAICIGPEGGWSDEERVFFEQEARYPRATLGASILRGETAGILGGYALIHSCRTV